jgi:hypothetical protein
MQFSARQRRPGIFLFSQTREYNIPWWCYFVYFPEHSPYKQ